MFRQLVALGVFTGVCISALFAQHKVSPEYYGHKVWAVVPLTGKGTTADPRRPILIPSETETAAARANGTAQSATSVPELLGYKLQISDDGKSALVEFTFSSPAAYHNFLVRASSRSEVNAGSSEALIDVDKVNSGQSDGKDISNLSSKTANIQTAVQNAMPGLQLFERGKATEAQILAAFQKAKAGFTFATPTPTATAGAQ